MDSVALMRGDCKKCSNMSRRSIGVGKLACWTSNPNPQFPNKSQFPNPNFQAHSEQQFGWNGCWIRPGSWESAGSRMLQTQAPKQIPNRLSRLKFGAWELKNIWKLGLGYSTRPPSWSCRSDGAPFFSLRDCDYPALSLVRDGRVFRTAPLEAPHFGKVDFSPQHV